MAALVVAQGAIVLSLGAPSLADPGSGGPTTGAGGAGAALGPGVTVDTSARERLDGSAGIAHLASVTAARGLATSAQASDARTGSGATAPTREGPSYSYPVTWGTPISGKFGDVSSSWPRGHAGMDFNGETGDPVYAATDGRVQYAEFNFGGYGNLVMIMRNDGTQTRYAHLDKIKVRKGDRVSAGDLIGTMGNSGDSSGSHLHFEVRVGGVPQDPLLFLPS